jgi:hypothetical protein
VPNASRPEPDIYVIDTLSPGEHVVREWGMFELGDDWQGDAFHWYFVNWEAFRELRRPSYGSALAAKWDVPLMYVGDWHKQPGAMVEPSAGDLHQARNIINDRETPEQQLVAPIVTLYPAADARSAPPVTLATSELAAVAGDMDEGQTASSTDSASSDQAVAARGTDAAGAGDSAVVTAVEHEGWIVRIDFWYLSKRTKRFIRVQPNIWPDGKLPSLPPLSWHLAHGRRFHQEHALLTEAGYTVDVVRWDADGRPPYEIVFSVYKPGSRQVVLLVTTADYPAEMPAVRVAPLVAVGEGEDVFEKVYDASQALLAHDLPPWTWDSKRTLIELVWHVEKLHKEVGA